MFWSRRDSGLFKIPRWTSIQEVALSVTGLTKPILLAQEWRNRTRNATNFSFAGLSYTTEYRAKETVYVTVSNKLVSLPYPMVHWIKMYPENLDSETEGELVNHLYRREIPTEFTTRWADLIQKECDWRNLGRERLSALRTPKERLPSGILKEKFSRMIFEKKFSMGVRTMFFDFPNLFWNGSCSPLFGISASHVQFFKKISKQKHPQKKNIRIDSGGLRVARCGWG